MSGLIRVICSGAKTKALTNRVSNGDMANGATGWQHYSNYSIESIVSGELKCLRNANRPYVGTTSTWAIPTGHKVYIAAKLYGNKAATVKYELYGSFGANTGGTATFGITVTPTRYSRLLTTASVVVNGLTIDGYTYTTSGDYIMIDNVIVIDLTAEFGAGLEPTVEAMDAMLSYLDGSYFDGTQQIIQAA